MSSNNAVGRLENLASQLGCTTQQLKIGAGAAAAGVAAIAVVSHGRAPVPLADPPKNAADTLPQYDKSKQCWTTDFTKEIDIHFSKTGPASEKGCPPTTVIALLEAAEKRCPKSLALAVERPLPKNDGVAAALPLEKWTKYLLFEDEFRI